MRLYINVEFKVVRDEGEAETSRILFERWDYEREGSASSFCELAFRMVKRLADFTKQHTGVTQDELNAEIEVLAQNVLAMQCVEVEE